MDISKARVYPRIYLQWIYSNFGYIVGYIQNPWIYPQKDISFLEWIYQIDGYIHGYIHEGYIKLKMDIS